MTAAMKKSRVDFVMLILWSRFAVFYVLFFMCSALGLISLVSELYALSS
jgi:hypothetical protein